jgi:hypothetical protein
MYCPKQIGCNKRNGSIRAIDHLWLRLIPLTYQPQPSPFLNGNGHINGGYNQPLVWIQDYPSASLVSLVPPFQRSPTESTTFSSDTQPKDKNKSNGSGCGGMSGYQIYRHYHDYHEVGTFFTHPEIAKQQQCRKVFIITLTVGLTTRKPAIRRR